MPLRKKAERFAFSALILLAFVTGCTHGGTVHADKEQLRTTAMDSVSDPGTPADKAVAVSVATGKEGPDSPAGTKIPDVKPEKKPSETGEDPVVSAFPKVTEEPIPPAETVGGDDVDEFFDEAADEAPAAKVAVVETLVPDPFITFNRAMFTVNDRLYFWCLKPLASGYKKVTPTIVRKGVRNFFFNLGTPGRLVNSLLQGKYKGAGSELGRFLVNTTVGVGGVWDPAERFFGWKPSEEDLGQTLGAWNVENGVYIVWPFLGPSTLRDTVGKAGDLFLNPLYYLSPNELAWGLSGTEVINDTSFYIGDYETVKSTYMDPYVMLRDLYITHRKKKIAD